MVDRRPRSSRNPASASSTISQCCAAGDVEHRARRDRWAGTPPPCASREGETTGTGVAPASSTSCGQQAPARPDDLDLLRRHRPQRGADQLARAVPDHHPRRARSPCEAAIAARSARAVRVGVDRPPQRERRRVDDLGVRRPVPGGAREVQRRLLGRMPSALLVAPLAQLARDLVRRELVELPVVAEEPPHQRGQRGRRALDHQEPDAEHHQRDHRRGAEDPRQRAFALVVARGTPHEPPRSGPAASAATRSRTARRGCRRRRRRSRACASRASSRPASRSTATPAAAAPTPTGTAASRTPGSAASAPSACRRRSPRARASREVHRPGARAAPDEEPAGVGRIVARHPHEDTRISSSAHVSRHNKGKRRRRQDHRAPGPAAAAAPAGGHRGAPEGAVDPFPLMELCVLIGIVCIVVGLPVAATTRRAARCSALGFALGALGGLDTSVREHFARLPLAHARAERVPGRGASTVVAALAGVPDFLVPLLTAASSSPRTRRCGASGSEPPAHACVAPAEGLPGEEVGPCSRFG